MTQDNDDASCMFTHCWLRTYFTACAPGAPCESMFAGARYSESAWQGATPAARLDVAVLVPTTTVAPEPSVLWLVFAGLVVIGVVGKRRGR